MLTPDAAPNADPASNALSDTGAERRDAAPNGAGAAGERQETEAGLQQARDRTRVIPLF